MQKQSGLELPYCAECDTFSAEWIDWCAAHPGHQLDYRTVSGRGQIWSWVTYRRDYGIPRPVTVPYVVAGVRLAEGPLVYGILSGVSDGAGLVRSQPVIYLAEVCDEVTYPSFVLDTA
jgi:uncharacterized OB-fold protein